MCIIDINRVAYTGNNHYHEYPENKMLTNKRQFTVIWECIKPWNTRNSEQCHCKLPVTFILICGWSNSLILREQFVQIIFPRKMVI